MRSHHNRTQVLDGGGWGLMDADNDARSNPPSYIPSAAACPSISCAEQQTPTFCFLPDCHVGIRVGMPRVTVGGR